MIIAVFILILLPVMIGLFFVNMSRSLIENIVFSWFAGFGVLLTWFEIIYLPALYLNWPFHRLCRIFIIVANLLAVSAVIFAIIKCNRYRKLSYRRTGSANGEKKKGGFCLVWIVVLGLILLQAYLSSAYMHVDDDDAYYVATATTSVHTDTIADYDVYTGEPAENWNMRYILSPYPTYLAMVSYCSGIHAAILAHVVYPAVFIPMAYSIYYLLAGILFDKEEQIIQKSRKKSSFMLAVCVMNLFGSYVSYSTSSFLLLRIWQGKAVVCSIMIPAVIYLFLQQIKNKQLSNWIVLFTTATAMSVLSSMGIFLAPLLIGVLAIVTFWSKRKLSYLLGSVICILPCLCLGALYILAK